MSEISSSRAGKAGLGTPSVRDSAFLPPRPVLDESLPIGAALKKARESLDLQLEDVAQATHVRAAFLEALERADLDPLPARPFAVGYVRAYARALGLDQDLAAARFRAELPPPDTSLRAPLGAALRDGGRFGRWALAALAVIGALAAWNLMVRLRAAPQRITVAAPAAAPASLDSRPATLGAPLPTPPEASAPPPYETPGLAQAMAADGATPAAAAAARIAAEAEAAPSPAVAPGAAFVARGQVFGAAAPGAGVILQALKPVSLVVRAPGQVVFARQLAAGEAWRAPAAAGLVADADIPAAIEVYVGGKAAGPLVAQQTAIESLTRPSTP